MNTFSLKVIASDKVFFDGKCGIIIVPALDGEQAIMSHHEDMVIATKEGEVRFKEKEDDDWTKAVVGVGCVYISHNRVIMLVVVMFFFSTFSNDRIDELDDLLIHFVSFEDCF